MGGEKQTGFAALGAFFAQKFVEQAVDSFVTPTGLARLGGDRAAATNPARPVRKDDLFKGARLQVNGLSRVSFVVPTDQGPGLRLVLSRYGLTWRLTNLVMPLSEFGKRPGSAAETSTDATSRAASVAPSTGTQPATIQASQDEACKVIRTWAEDRLNGSTFGKYGTSATEDCETLSLDRDQDGSWLSTGFVTVKSNTGTKFKYIYTLRAREPDVAGNSWRLCRLSYQKSGVHTGPEARASGFDPC
jgi:hypothetical protein